MVGLTLRVCCFLLISCAVFAAPKTSAGRVGGAIKKQPQCRPPTEQFLATLNATVRQQLKDIWADYTNDSTDCSTQEKAMKELFSAIDDKGSKKAAFGGRGGPTFLASASDEVYAEFEKIVMNNALNEEDKLKAVDEFMSKQSAELQSAYKKWKEEHKADIAKIDDTRVEIEKKIAAANLSEDAKAFYENLQKIKNSTMSEQEKWIEERKLKATVSDEVANEILNVLKSGDNGNARSASGVKASSIHTSNGAKKPAKPSN
uniref:Uncharacterized protein n=1 Tax=Plectus sambesii TaxID=2011161 RepID=A0A914VSV7_9BILA